jgi:hypothetical protein
MKKIMSYLKIFPRSIIVKIDSSGDYVGRLTYDFEQYGRMVYDDDSNIVLRSHWKPHSNWLIQSTGQVHKLAGFFVFMKALNHYLFEIIQFDPVSQLCKSSSTEYEYYFERVYFDMGTGEFVSVKKMAVLNSDESKRVFQNLNIRS